MRKLKLIGTLAFLPAMLLWSRSAVAQYPSIYVYPTSGHCPSSQFATYSVSVEWDDPSNPSPPDYVYMLSFYYGYQSVGAGNSGQTKMTDLEVNVQYYFYLYNSQGQVIASAYQDCPYHGDASDSLGLRQQRTSVVLQLASPGKRERSARHAFTDDTSLASLMITHALPRQIGSSQPNGVAIVNSELPHPTPSNTATYFTTWAIGWHGENQMRA